jgi:hypothetical protein
MVMRVIFLECDGVLHPASAASRFVPVAPLKREVQRAWLFRWAWILEELLEGYPDVQIVVHSNWRLLATDDELRSFLGPLARRFIGCTPRGQRWDSILSVIERSRLHDYIILDALPSAFPQGLTRLIECNPEAGLKDYRVRERIKAWLRAQP